jgi:hypothetical protein
MVKFKELFGLIGHIPSGGLSNRLLKLGALFLLLLILTFGLDVAFGDEFDVNVLGKPFLFLRVGADTVLDAHPIDSVSVGGVDLGGEILDLLERLILLREDFVDVISYAIEGFVVLDAVLLMMGAAIGDC